MSASDDYSLLAGGGYAEEVKIYQNNAGTFTFQQTLVIGFSPWDIKIDRQTLIISGQSADLLIYTHSGTGYTPSQNISFSTTGIPEFIASADLEKLTFGAGSEVVEYSKVNGSYLETDRMEAGVLVSAIKGDSAMDYVILLGGNRDIYVFYQCSSFCVDCSFPNNCSAC